MTNKSVPSNELLKELRECFVAIDAVIQQRPMQPERVKMPPRLKSGWTRLKAFYVLAVLTLLPLIASAATGVLLSSQPVPSATGTSIVWTCVYQVNGQRVSLTLDHQCPATLQFK